MANKKRISESSQEGKVFVPSWQHFNMFSFLSAPDNNSQTLEHQGTSMSEHIEDNSQFMDEEGNNKFDELHANYESKAHQLYSEVLEIQLTTEADELQSTSEDVLKVKWSVEEEIILIDFFHTNPCLWDTKLVSYKSAAKSSLIDDVGVLLNKKFSRNNEVLCIYVPMYLFKFFFR